MPSITSFAPRYAVSLKLHDPVVNVRLKAEPMNLAGMMPPAERWEWEVRL